MCTRVEHKPPTYHSQVFWVRHLMFMVKTPQKNPNKQQQPPPYKKEKQ